MIRIAVIGIGQIARQQHLPVIAHDPDFTLVAAVSPVPTVVEVPVFRSLAELKKSGLAVDAVALCTPPDLRYALAHEALSAGWHVLLEKPPTLTRSQAVALVHLANQQNLTVFAAWHSVYSAAVPELRKVLPELGLKHVTITWKENAEKWHPGASWLWQAGALGVFDAGINALSILCAVLPETVLYESAKLYFHAGQQAPCEATLSLRGCSSAVPISVQFDWRHDPENEIWEIIWEGENSNRVVLQDGGARLLVNGCEMIQLPSQEYAGVYQHFASLIGQKMSSLDLGALDLVTDALAFGERVHRQ
ncbi:Gfo/Idh/MocA family protein [Asaia prunellae]|uniref:Gfo/Idh/MocA family protein n=1 Tax=Asaia prunellae TaxID=610245 RepID=UPI00046F02B1|nr:Gfo/Idh/MocA family oxidoreductase [Asaia prunellae]